MMNAIRPSKLNLLAACPASAVMSRELPDSDNSAMSRGRDLHERAALALVAGVDSIDPDGSMNETDRGAIVTALKMAEPYITTNPVKRWVEESVDLTAYGFPPDVGTVDAAFLDKGGTLTVIDWKFGAMPVKGGLNLQLAAYALGIVDQLTPMDGLREVVAVVIQPGQEVNPSLYDVSELNGLRERIKSIVQAAQLPQVERVAGPWCRGEFCPARQTCPSYADMSAGVAEKKAEVKAARVAEAVGGLTPVEVDGLPGPLVVISREAVERAEELKVKATLVWVTDQPTAEAASGLLSEVTKFEAQVEANRKQVKAPVLELGKAIDKAAQEALAPLASAKAELKARLDGWMRLEWERVALAHREAEEARLKAEKLASKAKTPEAKKKAAEAILEASKAIPEAPRVAGLVERETIEVTVLNFAAMPDEFKLPDMVKLRAAVKSGLWKVNGKTNKFPPWLKVTVGTSLSSRG